MPLCGRIAQLSPEDCEKVWFEADEVLRAAAAGIPLDRVDVTPAMERLAQHATDAYRRHGHKAAA